MVQTQKKKYRRYFHYQKEILNTISEPASFINNNYRYIFVNNAFNKFFDKQTDEIIGKTPGEIWGYNDFSKHIIPYINKALAGEPVSFQYEGTMANGKFIILEINYYPHYTVSGKVDGIIATTKDITEQLRAEHGLKESEARLKELNAMKDKLFSIIGHDLKGPLNNIVAFSELIEEDYKNYSKEEIRKFNHLIFQSAQSISSLLKNLLTWSNSQLQNIKISPRNIPINSIVEDCFKLLEQNALQKQIQLINDVLPETSVFADEEMITTVIRNLISNAIKFTGKKGAITIAAKPANNKVIIAIQDNGTGIPKEKIQFLFQADETYASVGTDGEKGTGLGLIICKDFIEKNNGKIWVESQPGKGSVFYFSLPAINSEKAG